MTTWKCVCGRVHQIKPGYPIRCSGPGHNVYLSPQWFNYRLKGKEKSIDNERKIITDQQISLF